MVEELSISASHLSNRSVDLLFVVALIGPLLPKDVDEVEITYFDATFRNKLSWSQLLEQRLKRYKVVFSFEELCAFAAEVAQSIDVLVYFRQPLVKDPILTLSVDDSTRWVFSSTCRRLIEDIRRSLESALRMETVDILREAVFRECDGL